MGSIDPTVGWAVLIIMMQIGLFIMSWRRTSAATKRRPSLDTDIGTISTKIGELEKDLDETKQRMRHHEDKISRQVGALHQRINDVFGELREITGMLKTHMENGK